MGLVLMWNIFEFDMRLFIQIIGTAMGTQAAPTFANLFMGKMDVLIKKCAFRDLEYLIHFYKRFIDHSRIVLQGVRLTLFQNI